MSQAPGALMRAEIEEQPEALQRLLDARADIAALAEEVRRRDIRFVLLAARGSSDHAALYAKYLIETVLGLPCGLASMSSITAYRPGQSYAGVLWVAVSQSGGSPDLREATRVARDSGALTLAVTNDPASPLAAETELHLDIRAGLERSVAATKTYTGELLALWLFVDALAGRDGSAVAGVPAAVARAVRDSDVSDVVSRYRFAERLVTVGRGFSYPTAREGALKLMETCHLAASAFSGADLLHGPVAHVDRATPVMVIGSGGAGSDLLRPVVDALVERGADVTLVRGSADDLPGYAVPVPDVPEELTPLVQIVPLQLIALELALSKGLDPDRPSGLSKVTRTL
jgi:glucosamine--fructose-6-phosphate aminotransferase (isomerizing)